MTVVLYVDSVPVELNGTTSATPLAAFDESPVTLVSSGYSTAGITPGPREFPEILEPEGGEA